MSYSKDQILKDLTYILLKRSVVVSVMLHWFNKQENLYLITKELISRLYLGTTKRFLKSPHPKS